MTLISTDTRRRTTVSVPSILTILLNAIELRRQRNLLKSLDECRLNDLGLSREEALSESNRPIWDVPTYWQR